MGFILFLLLVMRLHGRYWGNIIKSRWSFCGLWKVVEKSITIPPFWTTLARARNILKHPLSFCFLCIINIIRNILHQMFRHSNIINQWGITFKIILQSNRHQQDFLIFRILSNLNNLLQFHPHNTCTNFLIIFTTFQEKKRRICTWLSAAIARFIIDCR